MIPRYTLPLMREIWNDQAKYERWLSVELAMLRARVKLGSLDEAVYQAIAEHASVNAERINEIDKAIEHDLNAFIECVHESLQKAGCGSYAGEFHLGMTSYDTEDPALVLILREAVTLVLTELRKLREVLRAQSLRYQWTLMIASTHGQDAEPSTFGALLRVYYFAVGRSITRLEDLLDRELSEARMSGAVGNYAGCDPKLAAVALENLGLREAAAETQILQRDRHAQLTATLAVAAGTMEQIARTFWELMRSRSHELEEPRKPKQKGSSAMAHKKNPILCERIMGMARLVRGNTVSMLESIATPEWRDVSQSSVERVALADALTTVHYMASKLTWITENLVVYADRMRANLDLATYGVWAGQQVRNALMRAGVSYEVAYRYVQEASFNAVKDRKHVKVLFQQMLVPEGNMDTAANIIGANTLDECFDPVPYIRPGILHLFSRS